MKRAAFTLALTFAVVAPGSAMAYVGPGAGLSLLGALWALIAAVGLALFFIVAWPVRRMLRKRRSAEPASSAMAVDDLEPGEPAEPAR